MVDSQNQHSIASVIRALKGFFESLPSDYASTAMQATELRHVFHEQLAAAIQPRLNDHLQRQPQKSLEEKQALASWVNAELRHLGLTMRCPQTSQPATLIADYKTAEEAHVSRFRIQSNHPDGKRVRSNRSASVPFLELMEDPPRRESLAREHRSRGSEGFSR